MFLICLKALLHNYGKETKHERIFLWRIIQKMKIEHKADLNLCYPALNRKESFSK